MATPANYCQNCGGRLLADDPLAGRPENTQATFKYPANQKRSEIITSYEADGVPASSSQCNLTLLLPVFW